MFADLFNQQDLGARSKFANQNNYSYVRFKKQSAVDRKHGCQSRSAHHRQWKENGKV